MKAFFAAVIGKSVYEKWKVNEPGVFYFLFYVQSREIPKKPIAGVARKESRQVSLCCELSLRFYGYSYKMAIFTRALDKRGY